MAKMFTVVEYSEAIQALLAGLDQLRPDGNCCAICGDSGHQAWECHHNPLVIMRRVEEQAETIQHVTTARDALFQVVGNLREELDGLRGK